MRRKNVEKSIIMKLLTLLVQCTWMGQRSAVSEYMCKQHKGTTELHSIVQLPSSVIVDMFSLVSEIHFLPPLCCSRPMSVAMLLRDGKNGIFYHVFIRFLFKKVHFTLLLSSSTWYVLWMDGKFCCCCRRFTFFYVASEGEDDEHWAVLQKIFCNASEIIWKIFFYPRKSFHSLQLFQPPSPIGKDWRLKGRILHSLAQSANFNSPSD